MVFVGFNNDDRQILKEITFIVGFCISCKRLLILYHTRFDISLTTILLQYWWKKLSCKAALKD